MLSIGPSIISGPDIKYSVVHPETRYMPSTLINMPNMPTNMHMP